MSVYKVVEKVSGNTQEIEAVSSKQALFKAALERVSGSAKEKRLAAGKLYEAMLKSHEALLVHNPNQMRLFQ